MKNILIAALLLSGCALTPEQRIAIGDGARAVAVKGIERLYAMHPGKLAIDPAAKDLIMFGCDLALDDGSELFAAAVDILAARFNTDPEVQNPVTGAEIAAHVQNVCGLIAALPENGSS